MEYKEKIIEMVKEIECEDYLFKIYHYILVKYRKYKEKSRKINSPGFYIFLPCL